MRCTCPLVTLSGRANNTHSMSLSGVEIRSLQRECRLTTQSGLRVRRSALAAYLRRVAFSVSHATLDPDRACSAARDGTRSLSKAAIRLTKMKKAGDTFLYVRCSVRVCRAPSRPCLERDLTPATTAIYDRGEPSYNRTATLDRIAQYLSLWCGSAALKPQILEPPVPW